MKGMILCGQFVFLFECKITGGGIRTFNRLLGKDINDEKKPEITAAYFVHERNLDTADRKKPINLCPTQKILKLQRNNPARPERGYLFVTN